MSNTPFQIQQTSKKCTLFSNLSDSNSKLQIVMTIITFELTEKLKTGLRKTSSLSGICYYSTDR